MSLKVLLTAHSVQGGYATLEQAIIFGWAEQVCVCVRPKAINNYLSEMKL